MQVVSLGRGCVQHGIVLHELLHVLGMWHEQSRLDRDQHVRILWHNILLGKEDQFARWGSLSFYSWLRWSSAGTTATPPTRTTWAASCTTAWQRSLPMGRTPSYLWVTEVSTEQLLLTAGASSWLCRWAGGGAEDRAVHHRCGQVVDTLPVLWWTVWPVQPGQYHGQVDRGDLG